jgi:hypothetical protein
MRRTLSCMALLVVGAFCASLSAQTVLSQSTNQTQIDDIAICAYGLTLTPADNSYGRVYSIATNIDVIAVEFGVAVDGGNYTEMEIRLWEYTGAGFDLATATQIGGTTAFNTPGDGTWDETIVRIYLDQAVALSSGQDVFVEVRILDGVLSEGMIFLGGNNLGESGQSYRASPCSPAPTTATEPIALPAGSHLILNIVGFESPSSAPSQALDLRTGSDSATRVAPGGDAHVGPYEGGVQVDIDIIAHNRGASSSLSITGVTTANTANCAVGTPNFPATVALGQGGTITIPVTPVAGVGNFSFDLTVNTNDPGQASYTVTVRGTRGLTGTYVVNPTGGVGDYDDIGDAFDDLENFGVVGAVVIEVAAGTYTPTTSYALGYQAGGGSRPVRGLGATNPLTIRAASGARPVIDGAGAFGGVFADPMNLGISVLMGFGGVTHVTIEGFTFRNGSAVGLMLSSDKNDGLLTNNITVRRCEFHTFDGPAVWVTGWLTAFYEFNFINNMVRDVGGTIAGILPEVTPGAVSLWNCSTSMFEHNTIRHNNGNTNRTTGAIGWTGLVGSGGGLAFSPAFVLPPEIRYNILSAHQMDYPTLQWPNMGVPLEPTDADENLFYTENGARVGLQVAVGANPNVQYVDLAAWTAAFPTLDVNSEQGDPLYVSATDLSIQSASPAGGLAVSSTVADDYFGTSRPQGAERDAGAHEIVGGGTGPGPGPASIDITTPSLPDAIAGTAYDYASVSATASNTSGTYAWSLTGAPGWMSINGTGLTAVFGGTPPAPATGVTFTVNVEDAADSTINDSRQYTIDVLPAGTMVITTPDTLPNAVVGQAYPATSITVIGGTAPYTWSIQTGPSWMGVTGTSATASVINTSTVTPAQTGVNIIISVSDSGAGTPATRQYTIDVTNPPLPGGGGGGGGGGGCSISGGSSLWLIAIGAIGGFALLRRRRRVTV